MLTVEVLQGLLLPFLGTALGAAGVYVLKKELDPLVQKGLMGFAAGVMVAASVWSLLIPAMEAEEAMGNLAFLPAVIGFWAGTLFLLALDRLIPHLHMDADEAEGPKSSLPKSTMLLLAVTLHNIPEGMAVGVVLAGWLAGKLPRRCHYLPALARGRHEPAQGFFGGHAFRHSGANRRPADHPCRQPRDSCTALFAGLCCRSHALCSGGGTDTRDVHRPPFKCGCPGLCLRLYADDGAGCGAGIDSEGGLLSEKDIIVPDAGPGAGAVASGC